MSSTIGGDDKEGHDLDDAEKDRLEATLRRDARVAWENGDGRGRQKKLARATEVSRRKAKRADHH